MRALNSRYTIWVIAGLLFVQALWVAMFFRFSLAYDEQFHFGAIQAFSHSIFPIIIHQSTQYDSLGNLTFGNASLYHYLMSFPYRLIAHFTSQLSIQIIFLRLIDVTLAASAIPIFARFFSELGIKRAITNLGLFTYVCIPMVSTVAATINYDNLLLPLTALFLLWAGRIIRRPKQSALLYIATFCVGVMASLVKFTFLPIFLAAAIFAACVIIRKHKGLLLALKRSFRRSSKLTIGLWITITLLLTLIAAFRYGTSIILYHTPIPSCQQTMPLKRCLSNPVIVGEQKALSQKNKYKVMTPEIYTQSWANLILNGYALTSVNTVKGTAVHRSPEIYKEALAIGLIFSIFILLYAWRDMKKNIGWYFAITMLAALVVSTLMFNMMSYYQFHQNVNVQPRYLLSVLPILLVFSLTGVAFALRRYPTLKTILLVALLLVTFEGGGVITHIVESQPDWYWGNPTVQKISTDTRDIVSPAILLKDD